MSDVKMAGVRWIKIVTDVFDDEKILLIETMPEADSIIVIWFKLLCLAGKQNNSGVFTLQGRFPYTDEMFAAIFRRPLNTVRLALKTFETYGMVEIINSTVTIPNWGKHQSLDKIESRNKYMREYMTKYREEQRRIASGKVNSKVNSDVNSKVNSKVNVSALEEDIDIDIERDIDGQTDRGDLSDVKSKKRKSKALEDKFDRFWKVYPRKVAKAVAKKSFEKINPDDELLSAMIDAVEKYKCSSQWTKDNGEFIPHPSTWLNQKRWEDDVPTAANAYGGGKRVGFQDYENRVVGEVASGAGPDLLREAREIASGGAG